jgi:TM2 domain-containing membrane protein YozV
MDNEKTDWGLFFILFFFGWLGCDKFYVLKGKGWKLFLIKFLAAFIGLGEIWNILDLIMCLCRKYKADPRDYLDYLEKKQSY